MARSEAFVAGATTTAVILLVATAGMAIQRWHLLVGALVTEVGLILGPTLLVARRQGGMAKLFARGTLRGRDGWPLIGWGIGLFIASLVLGAVGGALLRAAGFSLPPVTPLAHLLGDRTAADLAWAVGIAVFLAPLCEEALFRGLLQGALEQVLPAWGAIGVAAVAFGLFHLSPIRFVPSVVLGLGAGVVRAKYQSVCAGVIAHATLNACGVSVALAIGLGR